MTSCLDTVLRSISARLPRARGTMHNRMLGQLCIKETQKIMRLELFTWIPGFELAVVSNGLRSTLGHKMSDRPEQAIQSTTWVWASGFRCELKIHIPRYL